MIDLPFVELWLLLLPLSLLIGVPAYIFFRSKMIKKPKESVVYSRRRVLKLTFVNLLVNSLAAFHLIVLFLVLNNAVLPLSIMFILIVGITFYGNGIYITSIVLEDYTLADLRKKAGFSTQFIATHLFHGPVSHVLIYSGWIIGFMILAVIDLLRGTAGVNYSELVMFLGVACGFLYGVGQIYNGTVPYQFITGVLSMLFFGGIAVGANPVFSNFPVALFFGSGIVAFNLCLAGYLLHCVIRDKHVDWDRSGY